MQSEFQDFSILHLFCGIGGAALGFQHAEEEFRGVPARYYTLGGIDCDPNACKDFEMLTGAPAFPMDLFTRDDYLAFHGQPPASDWQEVTPADIRKVTGGIAPDVVFTSPPCKGFSGLLPSAKAASDKYQALNRLVTRGLQLVLDAFADDPPAIIMLENVPRITSRGAELLKQVKHLLGAHGYVCHEGSHDCGELGGLAQRRQRYLLIARRPRKVPSFVYQPPKLRVRAIGEAIGPLPLPDAVECGPMHRLPRLQWKTWVRLALIPAGGDWRDLQTLSDKEWHNNAYRIIPWALPAGTVTSGGSPSCGACTVSDPRLTFEPRGGGCYGVQDWEQPGATVIGNASIKGSNPVAVADPRGGGAVSIADPRLPDRDNRHPGVYQVSKFDEPAPCVTGTRFGSGALAIADPRLGCSARSGSYGVLEWDSPATTVTGAGDIHSGSAAIADPRIPAADDRPDPPPIIVALDGTWHRPLTTFELAVLQGFPPFLSDGRPLVLTGKSDARWRERIGNAVPPATARAIGESILRSLLASRAGIWLMGSTDIWVRNPVGKLMKNV